MEDLDCIDQKVVKESVMSENMSQNLAMIRVDLDHLENLEAVVADNLRPHLQDDEIDPATDVNLSIDVQ